MSRPLKFAPLAGGILVALVASPLWAHGSGAQVEVEPDTVTAGGTVTIVGENLEPNDKRVLVLSGADVTLDLGEVTTDADGMFSKEITVPAHLPAAVYEVRAIGDEVLTVNLNVEAAPGMASAAPAATSEPDPRHRGGVEMVLILALTIVAAGIGAVLVARAERLGHPA